MTLCVPCLLFVLSYPYLLSRYSSLYLQFPILHSQFPKNAITAILHYKDKNSVLKLYGGARSRASIVQWYLEEIAIPYEFVILDLQAEEHLQPEFLEINPIGKVPAIVDGDFKLWESGAILLYLAQKYGKMPETLEQQAQIVQWVIFANATLGPGIFVEASRERETPKMLEPLNRIFEKQQFLMGDEFGVADAAVGSILNYIPMMLKLDLSAYPAVLDYMKRISERPAFKKAIGGS
jgi:glutathione S-transferase